MSRLMSLFTRNDPLQSKETREAGSASPAPPPLDAARQADCLYEYLFERARRADYANNPESDRIVTADGAEFVGRIQPTSTDTEFVLWKGVCLTADKSACLCHIPRNEAAIVERGLGVSAEERDRLRRRAEQLAADGVDGLRDLLLQTDWRMVVRDEPLSAVVRRLWDQNLACAYALELQDMPVSLDHWEGTGQDLVEKIAESAGCGLVISRATVDFVVI